MFTRVIALLKVLLVASLIITTNVYAETPLWAQVLGAALDRNSTPNTPAAPTPMPVEAPYVAPKAPVEPTLIDPTADTWEDPDSHLVWTRCPVRSVRSIDPYDKGACVSPIQTKSDQLYWPDTMVKASTLNYLGHSDWRLPTISEMRTILRCRYDKGSEDEARYIQRKQIADQQKSGKSSLPTNFEFGCVNGESPTFDASIFRFSNMSFWIAEYQPNKGIDSSPTYPENATLVRHISNWESASYPIANPGWIAEMLMVRGGTPSPEYLDALQVAKDTIARRKIKEQQTALAAQEDNAKLAEAQKKYAADLQAFRKSIKQGDKVANGLVIAVKGNLIRVQTSGKQCTEYSYNVNPYSHQHDCIRSITVATGEQWMNRDDVMPPAK